MGVTRIAPDASFETQVPLLIVGGGACGLVAGLAARAAGVPAVVLERDSVARGSTFMSSGFIPAAGSRLQAEKDIPDSAEIMAADIQRKNGQEADPAIVAALAEGSGRVIDWLAERHGIPFSLVEGFLYPGHSHVRMHATPRRTGEELMSCLLTAAEAAGIDLLTDARVVELQANDAGRIRGLVFERPDGGRETVGCQALILACSGFGADSELVARHLPTLRDALYYGHEGNRGDALKWGKALGASLRDLGACQGHGSLATPQQTLISWALMMRGGIQVNAAGRRFSNEHGGYSEQAAKVLAQPGGTVWNLFDDRIHETALEFEDYRNAQEAGAVRVFDDLPALAAGLDLPPEALEETFAELRDLAASGRPDAFGRRFTPETLLTAPYRAVRVTGALFHTQGGLEIDTSGRVLDRAGRPFPNLFAAGGAARGVSGSGDSGYLSGNGLLSAVVMGAIAGQAAAELAAADLVAAEHS